MMNSKHITERLLDDITPYIAPLSGPVGRSTPVPRLTVWTSTGPSSSRSAVFEPMFYAVLRGAKVLTMGANRFEMSSGACAASSFGLPYTHELIDATHEAPYVGISLHLDIDMLTSIVLDMPKQEDRWTCAVAAGDLNGVIGEVFVRLVGLVNTADDIARLAPHYESELYYRLLQSPMGDTLRQIVQRNERVRQIKVAADRLATGHGDHIVISELAASAGMSVTSFYRHFKAITGYSPLAFQHYMGLLEAQRLLAAGGASVARIAYQVGYQSPSQFSREYKKMFGSPPIADLQR